MKCYLVVPKHKFVCDLRVYDTAVVANTFSDVCQGVCIRIYPRIRMKAATPDRIYKKNRAQVNLYNTLIDRILL